MSNEQPKPAPSPAVPAGSAPASDVDVVLAAFARIEAAVRDHRAVPVLERLRADLAAMAQSVAQAQAAIAPSEWSIRTIDVAALLRELDGRIGGMIGLLVPATAPPSGERVPTVSGVVSELVRRSDALIPPAEFAAPPPARSAGVPSVSELGAMVEALAAPEPAPSQAIEPAAVALTAAEAALISSMAQLGPYLPAEVGAAVIFGPQPPATPDEAELDDPAGFLLEPAPDNDPDPAAFLYSDAGIMRPRAPDQPEVIIPPPQPQPAPTPEALPESFRVPDDAAQEMLPPATASQPASGESAAAPPASSAAPASSDVMPSPSHAIEPQEIEPKPTAQQSRQEPPRATEAMPAPSPRSLLPPISPVARAPDDPLAPLKTMSEAEKIALFS